MAAVPEQGNARTTFVIGALLTFPGASYLIGLDHIAGKDASTGCDRRDDPRLQRDHADAA